jgi:hypothetical protein
MEDKVLDKFYGNLGNKSLLLSLDLFSTLSFVLLSTFLGLTIEKTVRYYLGFRQNIVYVVL